MRWTLVLPLIALTTLSGALADADCSRWVIHGVGLGQTLDEATAALPSLQPGKRKLRQPVSAYYRVAPLTATTSLTVFAMRAAGSTPLFQIVLEDESTSRSAVDEQDAWVARLGRPDAQSGDSHSLANNWHDEACGVRATLTITAQQGLRWPGAHLILNVVTTKPVLLNPEPE